MDDLSADERARAIINSGEYLYAIDQLRQAEAAAVERTEFECWEEAVNMTDILSHPELVKWLREQLDEASRSKTDDG